MGSVLKYTAFCFTIFLILKIILIKTIQLEEIDENVIKTTKSEKLIFLK